MDSNNVKPKNKAKITVALLILFLVICATGMSAMYFLKKHNQIGESASTEETQNEQDLSGDITVSNETELRKALAANTESTITVTKEITVDKGFTVNGNKTLLGTGKLVMALYSEAYQHLLHVQTGATLVLDGVTLDGNGIAGGVKVETGGELTYLSGDILYGFPYGIETDGKVTMKGGTIDESIHTGIYVTKGGETHMESGSILDSGAASVKVAVDAYMKISGDSRLQGSGSTILNISGRCDVTGGVMSDCNSYLAGVSGELNVEYQGEDKDGMLEWYNCGRSVILANAESVINVKGLYIHDVKTYAVCNAEGTAKVNLENCLFEKIDRSAVVLKKGTITMKNIQMKDVKQHGILIGKDTNVTIENLTVTSPGARGIYNLGGTVKAKNIVITSPKEYGIGNSYVKDSETNKITKGNMDIENLTITGAQGACTINVDGSILNLKDAKIGDSKSHGIRLKNESNATLTNVNIDKPGAQGIRIESASKANATNLKITNSNSYGVTALEGSSLVSAKMEITNPGNSGVYVRMSKADINGLTVTEPKARGIYSQGGTVTAKDVVITSPKEYGIGDSCHIDSKTKAVTKGNVNVDGLTLTGVQGECAINVDRALLTLKNATITDSKGNGICLKKDSKATLTNVKLDKVGAQGLRIDTGSKVESTDVKLSNIGTYGVTVLEDSDLKSTNMEITAPGNSGVYVRMSKADVKGLTITEPKARGIYSQGGVVTAKDVVITSPKEYGIGDSCYIDSETKAVTKGNVTVDGLTLTGVHGECAINVDESLLTLKNATITDSEHNGICLKKGSEATLEKVSLDKVGAQGLRIDTGSKVKSTDVTLSNITSYGVTVLEGSELDSTKMGISASGKSGVYVRLSDAMLNGLNIDETGEYGIHNLGGSVEAYNVEITSPKEYGIENVYYELSETEKIKGNMSVDGLTVTEVQGGNGIHLDTSLLTLTNAAVSNKNGNGICIQKNSEATFTNVSVNEAKGQGLRIDNGAKVEGTVKVSNTNSYGVTVLENATLNCSKLEIANTGNSGLYVRGSKADINDLTITDIRGEFAVNVENSELLLDGANISKLKDRGVRVTSKGKATLTNAKLYDSVLDNNENSGADSADTGFVHVDKGSTLTVKGDSIIEGQKANRKHGVWLAGTLNLEQGVIRGFKSDVDGAGVYVTADGTASITGGEISGNKTTQNGGALYVEENATVTIAGGSYNNNQAFGGGVVFSNANMTISGGTFNNNKASGSSAKGGVVYLEKNKLTISGGTFTNNSAPWGGVVYTKGTTEVTGGIFDANSATAVGGAALMSNKGNIKILGTAENKVKFQNNYVSADANNNSDGGGGVILLINEAALTLQNCEFSNNLHVGNAAGNGTDGCDIVFVRNPASGNKHELILMDKTFNGIVKITKAHSAGRFVIKTDDTDWNLGRTAEGLYTLNYDSKQLVPKAQ